MGFGVFIYVGVGVFWLIGFGVGLRLAEVLEPSCDWSCLGSTVDSQIWFYDFYIPGLRRIWTLKCSVNTTEDTLDLIGLIQVYSLERKC